jgi:hypothetical protein
MAARFPLLCADGCTEHPQHIQKMAIDADGFALDRDGRRYTDCAERTSAGTRSMDFHNCGRKLKGDPEFPWLCAMHIAMIHRSRSRSQQRASLREEIEALRQTANAELEALNTRLGITSELDLSYPVRGPEQFLGGRPTGNAVVPIEKLRELANQLHDLETELKQVRGW